MTSGTLLVMTAVLLVTIFVLSAIPVGPTPRFGILGQLVARTPPSAQKVLHVVFYATLAWLAWEVMRSFGRSPWSAASIAFVAAVGYGCLNEWCQTFIPGRFGTVRDALLNALGAAIGLASGLSTVSAGI